VGCARRGGDGPPAIEAPNGKTKVRSKPVWTPWGITPSRHSV
jgi:hypothetical protein